MSFKELEYKKISPIAYDVEPSMNYIIFTEGYDSNWRLGDEKPIEGYPVNIYLNKGTKIRYVRSNSLITAYLISLVIFVVILFKKR